METMKKRITMSVIGLAVNAFSVGLFRMALVLYGASDRFLPEGGDGSDAPEPGNCGGIAGVEK